MAEDKDVHKGHRKRMMERFSKKGIGDFHEHEKLEVLLYQIIPRINTNIIAHNLINYFGSLKSVFLAPIDELVKVKGIGEKSALQLRFVGALANFLNGTQATVKACFDDANQIMNYFINYFKDKITEEVILLLLDEKYALLHSHQMCSNMPNYVNAEFREIVSQAMKYNARKLVIAHNHPVGTTEPSGEDLNFTRTLRDYLKHIKVELIDHIIVSNGEALSMRESGRLGGIWED